ncbi:hypothetical protein GCM10022214_26980 [Actinomadura miaoliensis]|uniref:DUF488 family protein n=1 Tax=Actinomadura miaoliensis TaxID=430685 RepID=A0ABP7VMS8_9ACTN
MMPVLRMVTIVVYGFDGESFLPRLQHTDVRLLLDIRQRRGVRGPEYAWANSLRLRPSPMPGSPTSTTPSSPQPPSCVGSSAPRTTARVGKRSRCELAVEYAGRYTAEILDSSDLPPVVSALSREWPAPHRRPVRAGRTHHQAAHVLRCTG